MTGVTRPELIMDEKRKTSVEYEHRRRLCKVACELHTMCDGQVLVYFKSADGTQYTYASSDSLWCEVTTYGIKVDQGVRVDGGGDVIVNIGEKKHTVVYPSSNKCSVGYLDSTSEGADRVTFPTGKDLCSAISMVTSQSQAEENSISVDGTCNEGKNCYFILRFQRKYPFSSK